jgi:nitrite reductase/ring-hydroxylating ferredoxin subunit
VTSPIDAGAAQPTRPDEIRVVASARGPVVVAHISGRWYAFDDSCTHHECPLADGYLEGTTIECDCHGSVFDVTTGAVLRGPAIVPIRVYPTRQQDGRLLVEGPE